MERRAITLERLNQLEEAEQIAEELDIIVEKLSYVREVTDEELNFFDNFSRRLKLKE